jgi:hypothetical protein
MQEGYAAFFGTFLEELPRIPRMRTIVGCLALLYATLQTEPAQLDKVIGVITTIIGTAAGFIGGRGIRGQDPEG